MNFSRLSIPILLVLPIIGCQSSIDYAYQGALNDHSVKAPEVNTPVDETSAIMMSYNIFKEITSQLPQDDKFGGFTENYTNLINRHSGVYYSDVMLSKWDNVNKIYEITAVTLNSGKPIKSTYIGVNGYGAKFNVYRVVLKDDRISFQNHTLKSISIDEAKEIDNTKARIYYRLNNKGDLGLGSNNSASSSNEICKDQLYQQPSSTFPYEIWDQGCQINAEILKVVTLKNNKELELEKNENTYLSINSNYSITDRAFDILKQEM